MFQISMYLSFSVETHKSLIEFALDRSWSNNLNLTNTVTR